MRQEGDVIVMSWGDVVHTHPVTYELQLKSGSQEFIQVGWERRECEEGGRERGGLGGEEGREGRYKWRLGGREGARRGG